MQNLNFAFNTRMLLLLGMISYLSIKHEKRCHQSKKFNKLKGEVVRIQSLKRWERGRKRDNEFRYIQIFLNFDEYMYLSLNVNYRKSALPLNKLISCTYK